MGAIESKTTPLPPQQGGGGLRAGNVSFSPELLAKLQDEQKMRIAKSAAQAPVHHIELPNLDPIPTEPTAHQLELAAQFQREALDRALAASARSRQQQDEAALATQAADVLAKSQAQLVEFQKAQARLEIKSKCPKSAQDFILTAGNPAATNQVFQKMRMFEGSVTS